ncbi:hypothetical protein EZJ55_06705 [Microcystis aeruginosa EAWAG127a]|uniref:Novel STAND NTPase 1 domain-containing protein n=1 Tax=Microcystis aeruginosa EAWAG127a TaxID=2529855 RepID=A0A5J5LSY0_MICAE|nr:AAA family ATPase [Microcystis aeruginosa]KAB0240326.1 hypothetical protein EZJ55_06705 [Microcystis aeruginosa EAWAG127a]
MVGNYSDDVIMADNDRAVKVLTRAIRTGIGKFSLNLARCNYSQLRESILDRFHQENSSFDLEELTLSPQATRLFEEIETVLRHREKTPSALIILGLEQVESLETLFSNFNQVRTQFQNSFQFPLLLWVTDEVLVSLRQNAPDFVSGGKSFSFHWTTTELSDFLHKAADELFHAVLQNGAIGFLPYTSINSTKLADYRRRYQEIASAWQELERRQIELEQKLRASYIFAQGGDCYDRSLKPQPIEMRVELVKQAIEKYQESLVICQTIAEKTAEGTLDYCLSLCHHRLALLESSKAREHWQEEEKYLSNACQIFDNKDAEIAAKLRNELGGVLQNLEKWPELSQLAADSIALDSQLQNPLPLAQDYSFQAKIALEKAKETKEKQEEILEARKAASLALQALKRLKRSPQIQRWHTPRYLLLLAQAKKHLEKWQLAIKTLKRALQTIEDARDKLAAHDHYEPALHIEILEELQEVFFHQRQYEEAFQKKQEILLVKGQNGLLAFVGASSLRPPVSPTGGEEIPDRAIDASGRQQDVEEIIRRLSPRNQKKLTIVLGPSGVGKTSMLEAGLVPQLRQEIFEGLKIMPLFLRLSKTKDWREEIQQELEKERKLLNIHALVHAESENTGINAAVDRDVEALMIERLKSQQDQVFTVLILDQFEDFFFICKNPQERTRFFDFLKQCFGISNVLIVISLREDYLHYLLELEKYIQDNQQSERTTDADYQDVLSYKNRYPLHNFTKEKAKELIRDLTSNSQFKLEDNLIEKLVDDLAGNTEQVRPIELQIVGAQLQEEEISSLAEYIKLAEGENSPKHSLIKKYLNDVVKACGEKNKEIADLVLYLLTDEDYKRPIKTLKDFRETIENNDDITQLPLVLDIFVQSKLVVDYKETSEKQYQLLHDYLARLIREQSKAREEWYRAKIDKISMEAANAKAEAAAAEARAAEAESKVKLEIDLDEANKAKEQAIHDREQAESARKQAIQEKEAAERRKEEVKKISIVGSSVVGVVVFFFLAIVLPAWMTSDRLTKENSAEIDGARVMKSFNSGYGNLENFFFRALQLGQKFNDLVKINSFQGFDGYPTTSPLLALQQTFETIDKQDIYRYDLGKEKNGKSINIMDVNLQQNTITTIHTNGQILQRRADAQGNYSEQKVKELANISKFIFQGKKIDWGQVTRIVFSPDGQKIALVIGDRKNKEPKKVLIWNNLESSPKEPTYHYEHPGSVNLLKFDPNSQWLMTVSESQIILYDTVNQKKREFLWEISPEKPVKNRISLEDVTSQKHSRPSRQSSGNPSSIILSADFSHDQKNNPKIALGFNSGEVAIVDLNNLAKIRTIQPQVQEAVIALDFNFDTQLLAIGFENGSLVNFDLTNNEMKSCPSEGLFSKVEFMPDNLLAIGYRNGLLKIIRRECQKLFQFKAHDHEVQGLQLSGDHQWLTTNSELEVRRWKLDPGQEFAVNPKNILNQASLSSDGKLLATATNRGIELWNLSDQKEPDKPFYSQNKSNGNTDPITSISFQPNNNQPDLLATGSLGGILSLWRFQSQTNHGLRDQAEVSVPNSDQPNSHIWSLTFSQDGSLLATGSRDGIIQIRSVAALLKNDTTPLCRISINSDVLSIAIRPDNQEIAIGSANGRIYLLNLPDNGGCVSNKQLEPKVDKDFSHFAAVVTVQYIPYKDNQWLLATGSDDLTARLWSLDRKEKVRFEDHDGSVRGIAYLPKDKVLVTASEDRSVRLWTWKDDLESIDSSQPLSGELIAKHNGHIRPIRGIFFRDQPRQLISISTAPKIRFWPIPESKDYLHSLMDNACKEVPNMEENKQEMEKICSKIPKQPSEP